MDVPVAQLSYFAVLGQGLLALVFLHFGTLSHWHFCLICTLYKTVADH